MSQRHVRPVPIHRRPVVWLVAAVAATAVVLVLVLVVPSGSKAGDPAALHVSMVEMAFAPSALHAHPGQRVEVSNDGAVEHSMLVVGLGKGVDLQPGRSTAFVLPADRVGTFEVICDLPGHQEAGMVGTMVVSAASVAAPTTNR